MTLPVALAITAASTAFGIKSSQQQAKIDIASTKVETAAAKNQAAQQAFEAAKGFRAALSSQLAISSLRGGGGSTARQFAAKSISNMMADATAFDQQMKFLDVASSLQISQAKAGRFSRDLSSSSSLLNLASSMALDRAKG